MASSRRLPASYNVKTYGNATRDYTVLATWEAATDNNLVTAAKGEVLECYDDSAQFVDQISLSGAITNSSYFRVVKPAIGEGHDGTPNNGVNFIADINIPFTVSESYSSFQDLIGRPKAGWAVSFVGKGDYSNIVGCISVGGLITHDISGTMRSFAINCLVLDSNNGFSLNPNQTGIAFFYNCTAVDCNYSFNGAEAGTSIAKNCISCDNYADFEGTWTKTTCYEGDATVFKDQANDDYHLAEADTTCRGNGTDLSSDAYYAFDDDIDGETRSAWDIGADEYSGAGVTEDNAIFFGMNF